MKNSLYALVLSFIYFLTFVTCLAQTNTNISNGVAFDGEPFIAINPVDKQNIVSAWMGLKVSGSQFRVCIKTRASFNGGNTWSTANTLPHFGTGYGSADVSMAFDKNGFLYICYIDYKQSPDSGGVYVSRSGDGGLNWDTPSKAFDIYDVASKRPVDRPWLAIDNSNTQNSGTLYITTKPAPWIAPPNRNYFKVSSDSGHSWTAIANIDGGTHLVGNIIAAPMASPATTVNGNFCAVYPSYIASQNIYPAYYLASSTNKGQTISYTTVIAAAPAANDTNYKNGYRFTTHPTDSNKMVFVATDATQGDADIIALHSNDGGQTWSGKVRVNDDAVANGKGQDMPWASYNEQGNLAVTWRDRRNANVNGFWNAGYDFYYAISADNGQAFSPNKKLSSQLIAFDSIISQNGNDFMGCVYYSDTLYTVWGDTRGGKMNIYFAKTIASNNSTNQIILLDGEESEWKIFPNPAKDVLNIKVAKELIGKDFSVYDSEGRKVLGDMITNATLKIEMERFLKGVYFLRIGNSAKKFVKQ